MKNWLLLALVAACFAGCSTETRGTRVTLDTETGSAEVLENSYRLSNRIKVIKCNYDECGEGIRKATVTIESQTKRRQSIQMRMVWLDAEGIEIDADGKPFRALVLDGSDTHTFTGVSPSPKGVKVKVQIRETETAE